MMKTDIETISPTKIALTIEIEEEKVKSETQKVFDEMAKQIQIKGFRKGKAPKKLIEKHINQSLLEKEVVERLLPSAYEQALKANHLRPASTPQFDLTEFKPNETIKVKATFEKLPDIPLPEYKGMEVSVKNREFKEEDVEKTIQNLQAQRASYEDIPNAVIEEGRGATVDFEGLIDGKPFEGGSSQGLLLDIQKEHFIIPGFMEQILGMKAGEDRDVKTEMPASFGPALAGKKVVFKVHVHAVKGKKLPPLDDAFAQAVGDFKTLQDLREGIRKNIRTFLENEEKNEALQKVLENLSRNLEFPVPGIVIEEHLKRLEREQLQWLASQNKPFDEHLKTKFPETFSIQGPSPEEKLNRALTKFREELQPAATERGKMDLILDEIVRKENLQVTQDEINSEIHRVAESSQMPPEMLVKVLQERQMIQGFIAGIRRAKAALLIKENLKISYETSETTAARGPLASE